MGSSERREQTHASATRQSNMRFAANTPIAVLVIGSCPITKTFVARTTKSGGTEKITRRRTGECLWPEPASAGASSAVGLTPPDLVGSGERRRWRVGRHWNVVGQPLLVHLYPHSQAGCFLGANRGPDVVADPLILEREEMPDVPLDDVAGARLPLLERPHSESTVSRNARNSPTLWRQQQPNVQFVAKMPITVAVIGICPIRKNFVARQPSREGQRRPASEANR